MGGDQVSKKVAAHVLLLPLPLQGPVNCFTKLAHLLSAAGLHLTLANAAFIHRRLPDLPSRFPDVNFSVLSDGIAGDQPRSRAQFTDMVLNFEAEFISRLPEFLSAPAPATCLIADGVFSLAGKTAMELGISVVYFSTLSPGCIWASCGLVLNLVDADDVPFRNGDNLDDPVIKIPGSEAVLRRRDLPGICRAQDMTDECVQLQLREWREVPTAQGHILNSFDELEGTALLADLRSICPNLYTIGPIHSHFKTRVLSGKATQQVSPCSSFWQEDRSCLAWLDAQPSKSVLFVSFGSCISVTVAQLMEFLYGLVKSGVRFLWVQRPDSIGGVDNSDGFRLEMPEEIVEGAKERGCVVKWAPQEEVLAHRAVGGFLTHSGWNSTLESVVEGLPMLCWPNDVDQLVISRFVEQVWKIGIDMKDVCDRNVIEDMVRDLMVRRNNELSKNADVLDKLATESVKKDGSSWRALDRLIEDIKLMRLEVPKCST